MLDGSRLIAFLGTRNFGRATKFYRDLLGLTLVSEEPTALVFDARGTMLRVSLVPELTPANYTVLGWEVPDIVATVQNLSDEGVVFERFSFLEQDEFGIWLAPGAAAQVAWFKDPDGNLLSLTEFPQTRRMDVQPEQESGE
jgi:catechol 2,3-dioxygenase-like lactoylglutathione lyase family enzyme